jgi:hypothetical protein
MLYRSFCGHITDYAIPFVLWSQYRLRFTVSGLVTIPCYTVLLVVTLPTTLYLSSCGHNTDYVIPSVLWSQYRLCYTFHVLVTIPTMLYRSSCGHNTDYAIPIPCSTANLKSMGTVRKVQSIALSPATLFNSASLNVLPCSSYQWCHRSHCAAATNMAINARVAEDVYRSDRSLIFYSNESIFLKVGRRTTKILWQGRQLVCWPRCEHRTLRLRITSASRSAVILDGVHVFKNTWEFVKI